MDGDIRSTHKKLTSSGDVRIQAIIPQLKNFFNNSTQSSEILKTIFEQYYPSSCIDETIIYLYSNSFSKPTLSKLLDQSVEYLHLNNTDNHYQIITQTENSTLLHKAISKDHENIFQLLLKCGYNPNSLLIDHKTPLSIIVVTNEISPIKRLEYIQLLITYGANAVIRDNSNVSPFKRLCGMESNYPIVYTFFRDHLLSVYPSEVKIELNAGLTNAVYNWCVPIVTDLIEYGAILNTLTTIDTFKYFLTQMSSTFFRERRSIAFIDSFILCLIQIILHNLPCENYSIFIEDFIKHIYIPSVCFDGNNDPLNHPSMINLKKFLYLSIHFGYLTKEKADIIQKRDLPQIITTPIQNPAVTLVTRQRIVDILNQHFDELNLKYYQNSISLKIISIRKIRQSLNTVNQKNIEQLNINRYLKNLILPKD